MSEPVYERLESTSDSDDFLRRLEGEDGEWLGIDAEARFVFGYPKRSGVMSASVELEVQRSGLTDPKHSVRVIASGSTVSEPFATEDEAKQQFALRVREAGEADRLGVVRVQRLFGRTVVQEEVVIQNASLAVEQFLDSQSLTFLGVVATIVIAFGFGFGVIAWWVGVLAAIVSLVITLGVLRWPPSRRLLVRAAAWSLGRGG
jgi:hypothetical protein